MPVDGTDPETEAMRAGAEIEQGAGDAPDVQHTPRTHPVDLPPTTADDDGQAALTTDPEAQQDDSVIDPEST